MAARCKPPRPGGPDFLTDGGLETTLLYLEGRDLPCFAAFPLLDDEPGRAMLRRYFKPYLDLAATHGKGFVLDTVTWRASADWGAQLGHDRKALARVQRDAVTLAAELRAETAVDGLPVVINGVVGPRGDGYRIDSRMSVGEARDYHHAQVAALAGTEIDMLSAITMTYSQEAIGIALAARDHGLPVVIAFTLETDGRLPSGETLREAVEQTDAQSGEDPVYYMVNCAHPSHFDGVFAEAGSWTRRIGGLRANASTMSHAELDVATRLDAGDPADLAARYRALDQVLPHLCVRGGCCGTDIRHIAAICEAC